MFIEYFKNQGLNLELEQPLVSVLMTAYNREKYITEAIESVLASTYKNFELIIVDDCSSDKTLSIAKAYEKRDNRIRVYLNENNLTDYPNRNMAAKYAKGKYIKYLDSDDIIYSEGLAYCVDEMERHPESSFGISMIDNENSLPSVMMNSELAIRNHLFQSPHLSAGPTGTIIKREFFEKIGGFDSRFKMASDSFFNIKVTILTPVVLLKNRFFNYRMHEDQEQNNPNGYFIYGYLANREIVQTLDLPLTLNEVKFLKNKFNKQHAIALLKHLIKKGEIKETFMIMKKTNFDFFDIFKSLLK